MFYRNSFSNSISNSLATKNWRSKSLYRKYSRSNYDGYRSFVSSETLFSKPTKKNLSFLVMLVMQILNQKLKELFVVSKIFNLLEI